MLLQIFMLYSNYNPRKRITILQIIDSIHGTITSKKVRNSEIMRLRFRRIILIQDSLLSEIYFQKFSNCLNISNYYNTNPLTTWSTLIRIIPNS